MIDVYIHLIVIILGFTIGWMITYTLEAWLKRKAKFTIIVLKGMSSKEIGYVREKMKKAGVDMSKVIITNVDVLHIEVKK